MPSSPVAPSRDQCLDGAWRAALADDDLRRRLPEADLDDEGWEKVDVPGHWRSVPAFADSDGPLFYRRRLEAAAPGEGTRAWLRFEGIFYQGDAWFDGTYLGDTEGYFFPHVFEITDTLRDRTEHVLAVEVACQRPADLTAKRNLTGIFQHWDCIDPAWNPGGIWAPVGIHHTGPIRIESLRVTCPDATPQRATLHLEAHLDAAEPGTATVTTTVTDDSGAVVHAHDEAHTLAEGRNRVRWRIRLADPRLWWPHALGDQPLHQVHVAVRNPDMPSDERTVTTGLRQVRMRNFVASVNGEQLFLKGTNLGPTRRALGEATPDELEHDIALAREANLDLVRIAAHISRRETYEAADRLGMLVWQDLPLQWGYHGVRKQAVRQAREAVTLLGHHPSIAVWCGHNEPLALDTTADPQLWRYVAGQALPSWNKTVLDRSVRRALDKADRSRPVVAHSGVLPHPAWATDTHVYFGWYHGHERDFPAALARFPILARFVSEFGAQAVPDSAEFMQPERWPDLDWELLERAYCLQKRLLDDRVPIADGASFDEWRAATQAYQATVVRFHIETLRRLKYRPTGGFCQFMLADAQPAVTWSVLDHTRAPKAAWQALVEACAPVTVIADRPAARYEAGDRFRANVHVVNDLRVALEDATVDAHLTWPGGERRWRFAGDVPADSCARVGRVDAVLDGTWSGEVRLGFSLRRAGAEPVHTVYAAAFDAARKGAAVAR
ncbi:MAG: hypothetical protein J2P57_11335 [Acidimicrobiaceae bacterium]|nr:hypothetical protein [Acidimicrobiaceae bacterium]